MLQSKNFIKKIFQFVPKPSTLGEVRICKKNPEGKVNTYKPPNTVFTRNVNFYKASLPGPKLRTQNFLPNKND